MKQKKEPLLSPKFALALQFANEIHATQKRKSRGAPYITHLLAVCSFVLEYDGGEEQAIAALLHDAAEDQGGRPMLDSIRVMFGEKVAAIVEACTDSLATNPNEKEEWLPRKSKYMERLAKEPDEAKLVTCADKLHNISNTLRDIEIEGVEAWKARQKKSGYDYSVNIIWYFTTCLEALSIGWSNPILNEFARTLVRLCEMVGTEKELATASNLLRRMS